MAVSNPSNTAFDALVKDEIECIDVSGVLTTSKTGATVAIGELADEQKARVFRNYDGASDTVKNLYTKQHTKQTVAFNVAARERFHAVSRSTMSVNDAMLMLDTLVDESDPDTSLTQIQHLLQSAEACRAAGKPRWLQLVCLIHDLGKLLFFFGADGQWDVVGDTYAVGCAPRPQIVFAELGFDKNPDTEDLRYSSMNGIYEEGCGMNNLLVTWGHDEYLYLVLSRAVSRQQCTLPEIALKVIRFHSFYAWHREGAYKEFMAEGDEEVLQAVREFNGFDLYSKSDGVPDAEKLRPYYQELIYEFFPVKEIEW